MLNAGSRANRVDPCGGGEPLRLTDRAGSITSPGGGWHYPNKAYCKWLIEAPGGQVRITQNHTEVTPNDTTIQHIEIKYSYDQVACFRKFYKWRQGLFNCFRLFLSLSARRIA